MTFVPSVDFISLLTVFVSKGLKKSLFNVFQDGLCHPRMALVIDDRLKVWDEKDQPRVHVVPAFAPYYAPQAEVILILQLSSLTLLHCSCWHTILEHVLIFSILMLKANNAVPVLCVARNVACNVRGSFFK